MLNDWEQRIVVDPKILVGKPVILGLLANDWTIQQVLDEYPHLKREDVIAVLKYAAELVKEEKAYPLPRNFSPNENLQQK
jgi:uncharacterized protein (DUF433 family)